MKSFISKTLLFCVPGVICLILLLTVGKKYFAAFRITNSYSFNEKVKYLPLPEHRDVLSIGSSMNLNNLFSPTVTSRFKTDSYLNTSVWGLSIMDVENLVPVFDKLYNPKTVICVSNVMDFATPQIEYNVGELSDFLKKKEVEPYAWFATCAYYLKHSFKNLINFNSNRVYTSLVFDKWGGVPLASRDFQTKKVRWNDRLHFENINPAAYTSLKNISYFYEKRGIHLIFIQPPVRKEIRNPEYVRNMTKHTERVASILQADGHQFINRSNDDYSDSLFVDSSHLNEAGARRLTEEAFAEQR